MEHDELKQWLLEKDAIVPSSGFAESVMDAVRREACEPPAIPFPWKRALPGLVALAAAVVTTVVGATMFAGGPDGPAPLTIDFLASSGDAAGWIALAAVVAAAPLVLSWRLTRGWL